MGGAWVCCGVPVVWGGAAPRVAVRQDATRGTEGWCAVGCLLVVRGGNLLHKVRRGCSPLLGMLWDGCSAARGSAVRVGALWGGCDAKREPAAQNAGTGH